MECKFCDGFTAICTNPDCPMKAEECPVPYVEGICKYEDREEAVYTLTPKGCASIALQDAGLVNGSCDPKVDIFWDLFYAQMVRLGYVKEEQDG